MVKSEGVPGYRIISDEVIKAIVEGKSSMTIKAYGSDAQCDQYFPLGDQHKDGFASGIHPDAAYRSGDGSDELYRGLLPSRCCMR
jgi:hypothetical protein